MASQLENIKTLLELNEDTQDAILNLYISRATSFIYDYCNIPENETLPTSLKNIVEDIAIWRYKLKGVEGVASESKGSLSEKYTHDLPADIKKQLQRYRRLDVR